MAAPAQAAEPVREHSPPASSMSSYRPSSSPSVSSHHGPDVRAPFPPGPSSYSSERERDNERDRQRAREKRERPDADRDSEREIQRQREKRERSSAPENGEVSAPVRVPWGSRGVEIFQKIEQIGEGTYGKVFMARNKHTNEVVALKKIRMSNEKEGFPITAIREIKILKELRHENIVELKEIVTTTGDKERGIYMVFEYMDHDLTGLMMSEDQGGFRPTMSHIKCYMKQLLCAIHHCHKNKILHRDIKGSNLLINNKGQLKLADFGLARPWSEVNNQYTNRVITLWYRPPELLLGAEDYGPPVDMWSVGCIFAELLGKRAIFPGKSEPEQLELIFQVCGTPTKENWPGHVDLKLASMLPKKPFRRVLREHFRSARFPEDAIELLDKMLTLDPKLRITADAALDDPFFWREPLPCLPEQLPKFHIASHEFQAKKRKQERSSSSQAPPPPYSQPPHQHPPPPHPMHNQAYSVPYSDSKRQKGTMGGAIPYPPPMPPHAGGHSLPPSAQASHAPPPYPQYGRYPQQQGPLPHKPPHSHGYPPYPPPPSSGSSSAYPYPPPPQQGYYGGGHGYHEGGRQRQSGEYPPLPPPQGYGGYGYGRPPPGRYGPPSSSSHLPPSSSSQPHGHPLHASYPPDGRYSQHRSDYTDARSHDRSAPHAPHPPPRGNTPPSAPNPHVPPPPPPPPSSSSSTTTSSTSSSSPRSSHRDDVPGDERPRAV